MGCFCPGGGDVDGLSGYSQGHASCLDWRLLLCACDGQELWPNQSREGAVYAAKLAQRGLDGKYAEIPTFPPLI